MAPEQLPNSGEKGDGTVQLIPKVYDHAFVLSLPESLADYHGFSHSDVVEVIPKIKVLDLKTVDAEVVFELTAVDEDVPFNFEPRKGNRIRINRPRGKTARLTMPRELVTSLGIDTEDGERGVASLYETAIDGKLLATVQSPSKGTLDMKFEPTAVTWAMPDDGGKEAFQHDPKKEWPVTKTLVKYKAGTARSYGDNEASRHDTYRLELPREFAHPHVLSLDGGEPVATRVAQIDGEPVLVLDLRVDEHEMDLAHVRTLFKSDWIEVGDKKYEQYRVLFSKDWMHALGWDADTELAIEPGPDRIVVARDGVL